MGNIYSNHFIALLIIALQPSDAYRRKEIFEEEKLRANMREEQERLKEKDNVPLIHNSTGKTINDLYRK